MKNRMREVAPKRPAEPEKRGKPCQHCRVTGNCRCEVAEQQGGRCCVCGGHRFLPEVSLEPWQTEGLPPMKTVMAARRPTRKPGTRRFRSTMSIAARRK